MAPSRRTVALLGGLLGGMMMLGLTAAVEVQAAPGDGERSKPQRQAEPAGRAEPAKPAAKPPRRSEPTRALNRSGSRDRAGGRSA
ncbi:MAG: hypothetical protein ACYTJ0_19795, partial [Planctomycetota bacterium]